MKTETRKREGDRERGRREIEDKKKRKRVKRKQRKKKRDTGDDPITVINVSLCVSSKKEVINSTTFRFLPHGHSL